jgi:hypothetical protein
MCKHPVHSTQDQTNSYRVVLVKMDPKFGIRGQSSSLYFFSAREGLRSQHLATNTQSTGCSHVSATEGPESPVVLV